MDQITNLLHEINLEEIEDECCVICQDIITNEFGILNCNCKTLYFHNKCLNDWLNKCKKCPQCSKTFFSKPSKFNKPFKFNKPKDFYMFASYYNILRIMSGLGGLSYSS